MHDAPPHAAADQKDCASWEVDGVEAGGKGARGNSSMVAEGPVQCKLDNACAGLMRAATAFIMCCQAFTSAFGHDQSSWQGSQCRRNAVPLIVLGGASC